MADMTIVTDENQDKISRQVGYYVYVDTQVWSENSQIHREDGPAVVFPNDVIRWYIHDQEITTEVNSLFREMRWNPAKGLNTAEKIAIFKSRFLSA